jgi:hypothetical protein
MLGLFAAAFCLIASMYGGGAVPFDQLQLKDKNQALPRNERQQGRAR